MTELLYLEHKDMYKTNSKIIASSSDNKGKFAILDRTLFCPVGISDNGIIKFNNTMVKVIDVKFKDDELRHYVDIGSDVSLNHKDVEIVVDCDRRMVSSRYYSAECLIFIIISSLDSELKISKKHQSAIESYIEFCNEIKLNSDSLEKEINEIIKNDSDMLNSMNAQNNNINILNRGILVNNLTEIGQMKINKIDIVNSNTRISYSLIY